MPSLAAVSTLRRNGHWLALRRPGMKYLVYRAPSETTELLYELESDPGERAPLRVDPDAPLPLRRELRAVLAWSRTFRDANDSGTSVDDLPESVREQLRSLGYIQ